MAEKLDWVRAPERPATLRFGIRLHVITRDTAEQAWAEADRLLQGVSAADIDAGAGRACAAASPRASAGCSTCTAARRDGLEVAPNLWAGVGLVRGGAGTALVGSHAEVADRIAEYAALGIDEFILSGYPHLEEAYWFGEGVLPELRRRGLWRHPDGDAGTAPASIPFAGVPTGGDNDARDRNGGNLVPR